MTLRLAMQVSADGFAADRSGGIDWMQWPWSEDWSWDDDLRRHHTELIASSDRLLISSAMAREGFNDHWAEVAARANDPQAEFARAMSAMPKLIASRTMDESRGRTPSCSSGMPPTRSRTTRPPATS